MRADASVPAAIPYRTLEIALGAAHYMCLNDTSKLFINTAYVLALNENSRIDYEENFSLPLRNSGDLAFGIGYEFKG